MADSLRLANMKEAHYEAVPIAADLFDTVSVGSNDEHIERDPRFVQDRFRVDRKKLEQMLQSQDEISNEAAEDFFQRIMDVTNTQITWPSKLKIGAKSKKDPHIKVEGFPDDVIAAKEEILNVLDTKSNRVTLKMDVSHTEHSHVIGKGGNNIKRVMQDTGCHIHFPDSNRGNNGQEKSNQVSIAGQPEGVEAARMRIRELLPLVFMFELPVTGTLQPLPDVSSPTIQQLQLTYNVTITFRQRPRMYVTTVIVRGSVYNAKAVKEATARLMEHLTGSIMVTLPVSMQLDIASQHHLFIIGKGGINIKQVMQKTGASIHFPDPHTVTPQRKGTVYITGSIESVYQARQQLIGYLPLVLMFDVKDDLDINSAHICHLTEKLDVYISIKPKPKQPSKSVIVKSIERNSANMYTARQLLLGLRRDETPSIPTLNGQPAVGSLGLSELGLYQSGPPNPSSSDCVTCFPGLCEQLMVIAPNNQYVVQNALELLNCESIQKALNYQLNGTSVQVAPISNGGSVHGNSNATSPRYTPCDSPVSFSSPQTVEMSSFGNTGNFGPVVTPKTSPSNSGHTLDLLGLSKTVGPMSPAQSLFLDGSVPATLQNHHGDKSSESGTESDGSDKRAPGSERKTTMSLYPTTVPFIEDYEQKKLMANKAMQKKPVGESRIPTDYWAGFGFSKSMPEAAIRENFGNRYNGPTMSTTYENPNCEAEGDVDRDPWKKETNQSNAPLNPAPGEYPSLRKKYDYCLSTSDHVDSAALPAKVSWPAHKPDLAELFSKMGLGKYTDLFQQQEIDLSTFLTMTEKDLKDLGIATFGARRKMLLAIADIHKGHSHFTSPSRNNPFHENGATNPVRRPDSASLSGRW